MFFRKLYSAVESLKKKHTNHPFSESMGLPDIIKCTTSQAITAPVSEFPIFSFNSTLSKAKKNIRRSEKLTMPPLPTVCGPVESQVGAKRGKLL